MGQGPCEVRQPLRSTVQRISPFAGAAPRSVRGWLGRAERGSRWTICRLYSTRVDRCHISKTSGIRWHLDRPVGCQVSLSIYFAFLLTPSRGLRQPARPRPCAVFAARDAGIRSALRPTIKPEATQTRSRAPASPSTFRQNRPHPPRGPLLPGRDVVPESSDIRPCAISASSASAGSATVPGAVEECLEPHSARMLSRAPLRGSGTTLSRGGEIRIIELAYRLPPGESDWPIGLADPALGSAPGEPGRSKPPVAPRTSGMCSQRPGGTTEERSRPASDRNRDRCGGRDFPGGQGGSTGRGCDRGDRCRDERRAGRGQGSVPAGGAVPGPGSWPKPPPLPVTVKESKTLNTFDRTAATRPGGDEVCILQGADRRTRVGRPRSLVGREVGYQQIGHRRPQPGHQVVARFGGVAVGAAVDLVVVGLRQTVQRLLRSRWGRCCSAPVATPPLGPG